MRLAKPAATVSLALSAAAAIAALATPAHAGVIGWGNHAGGSFFDARNWAFGAVPRTGDTAVFDVGGSYSVSLNKAYTTSRILVGDDAVNLNLNGHEYRLDDASSGSVLLGLDDDDEAGLALSNGRLRSSKGRIAYARGSYAGVTVASGARWRNTGPLTVGQNGYGELVVSGGGQVSSRAGHVGASNSGTGVVSISGSGSEWKVGSSLVVGGDRPRGVVTVGEGGLLRVEDRLSIGSNGKVVVDGGTVSVGSLKSFGKLRFDHGVLQIRDAGVTIGDGRAFGEHLNLSAGQKLKLGGNLEVNRGSMLELSGGSLTAGLDVVNKGNIHLAGGTLKGGTITNLGTVTGSGTITANAVAFDGAASRLQIALGGTTPGTGYDFLKVSGDVTLTTVEVMLRDGFVPKVGDHFEIVSASDIVYAEDFNVLLPGLPGGLEFVVEREEDCLHLFVVVPEPGAAGLIAMGAWMVMGRRRRG